MSWPIKPSPVIIGEQIGRLTVLEECPERNRAGSRVFKCLCSCGNVIFTTGTLIKISTRSCGCLQKEAVKQTGIQNRKEAGEVTLNHFERQYKKSKNAIKFGWFLTKEAFRHLICQNCHWCNREPRLRNRYYRDDKTRNKESRVVSDENAELHWVRANGIDRLDSLSGYTLDNCVPCCYPCNLMKSNLTQEEFLENINRISLYQKELNEKK